MNSAREDITHPESVKEINLTIPMIPDMEIAAGKTAEAVAEVMNLDEDKTAEVSMALIEACLNSFEHSHSEDRKVYITFRVEDSELTIILRDKGSGFDPESVEKPDLERMLRPGIRKRGWGLKLMESMMDSLTIESGPGGTVVTMKKKR
ncbi:MAG TPA: ATP-binding protein [Patescibacteria group bacterium]|nr:ATP-binding protein [Patescibacteria group bacterium]